MRISEALPPPEVVADKIIKARKERALLKRLFRLVVDARKVEQSILDIKSDRDQQRHGGAS